SDGNSDLAATAERLIARAKTRSVSNAFSAYASAAAGPTCPCSQPNNATPRQKRADLAPADNPAPASSGPVGIVTPPVVVTDPVLPPPVVVTPLPPRVHLPPRHDGDKPRGDDPTGGKPAGDQPTAPHP